MCNLNSIENEAALCKPFFFFFLKSTREPTASRRARITAERSGIKLLRNLKQGYKSKSHLLGWAGSTLPIESANEFMQTLEELKRVPARVERSL